jgi:hypothetical protein
MAFELLHAVKRPTVLKLNSAVDKTLIEAGKVAGVNTSGELVIGANDEAAPVGIFQVQGYVPSYQSTGLLDNQVNGAVGSAGGGVTVSLIAGAGAVFKTDQFVSLSAAAIGSQLVGGADGKLKVKGVSTAPVVGLLIGKEGDLAIVQLRI